MKMDCSITRHAWLIAGVVVITLLMWQLGSVFMLIFGMILIASTLDTLAMPLRDRWGWRRSLALAAVILVVLLLFGGVGYFAGTVLAEQFQGLRQQLPEAFKTVLAWVEDSAIGPAVASVRGQMAPGEIPWDSVAKAASITVGAISSMVLALFMGVYLAADPGVYKRGLVRLFPVDLRETVSHGLQESAAALRRWLLGQFCSMMAVGAMTAVGLWALGMEMALVLALISGLLAFIPFFGPILAGLLAVVLAFTEGAQQALYVGILFVVIQEIEGNLLMPRLQRWAVELPPVLGLMSVVVFGLLFGMPGAIFATPLMVVVMVLVRELYVKEMLEGRVQTIQS